MRIFVSLALLVSLGIRYRDFEWLLPSLIKPHQAGAFLRCKSSRATASYGVVIHIFLVHQNFRTIFIIPS